MAANWRTLNAKCPLCGSGRFRLRLSLHLRRHKFDRQCSTCNTQYSISVALLKARPGLFIDKLEFVY